jgi:hypothetical protein
VRGVILVAPTRKPRAHAQHLNHRPPQPWRKPIKKLKQNRIVRSRHDTAVERDVGVNVIFNGESMLRPLAQCPSNRSHIRGGAASRRERRRLNLDRGSRFNHRENI